MLQILFNKGQLNSTGWNSFLNLRKPPKGMKLEKNPVLVYLPVCIPFTSVRPILQSHRQTDGKDSWDSFKLQLFTSECKVLKFVWSHFFVLTTFFSTIFISHFSQDYMWYRVHLRVEAIFGLKKIYEI